MKTFIEPQFANCPLVWMCCDKTSDNRINHLHVRAHRTVYNANVSRLEDNSVTIHVGNLTLLAIELYKRNKI